VKRAVFSIAAVAALIAAAGGFVVGRAQYQLALPSNFAIPASAAAQSAGEPIYYQDPDGKPFYSSTPRKTGDGRDYRAMPASADVSFENTEQSPATAADQKTTDAKSARKIKYYRNPMGLPDTSPVPKKDSMGMDYIPVFEGDDSDDGFVKLSPGKIQRTGAKSEPAELRRIRTLVRAPGTIQLDERRVSVIAMRSESFLQKVADVTTGSRVAKGEPLMDIYSPAVSSAAAEYISTLNSPVTGGIGLYGRGSRQRLVNLDVPESAIIAMEKTRIVPIDIKWSAPRDGIVLQRNAVEGMRAQPGDVLFRIADVSLVWALVDVAERDLGNVAVGQSVTVRARSYPGRQFDGKISVIYPQVNRDTRTARVRIELQNADLALLPDMYVDAEIDTGSQEPVLAVAESSVLDTGSSQAVLVDRGQGRFEPRAVKLGRRGGGYIEIRHGIAEGDAVVTSANFLIDAESNLKAALKGFAEAGSPQAAETGSGDKQAAGDRP
jgi:membrane fusion protein, copper/silver efflux system